MPVGEPNMFKHIPAFEFKYLIQTPRRKLVTESFSESVAQKVLRFHRQLPDYQPTRLVRLRRLAASWGLDEILIKDESTRFGLLAFKALGGSYAVARLLCEKLGMDIDDIDYENLRSNEVQDRIGPITLTTATDGNHGRGVAWTAEQLGQKAVIFMPKGSASSRVDNIRSHGAIVEVTDLNYDDTVRLAYQTAQEKGWVVIQDTAGKDYQKIPIWIMQGYVTMFAEAAAQMSEDGIRPTHVFLQAGVGSFAAAAVGYLVNTFKDNPPRFIIMEPTRAACMLASAQSRDGRPQTVTGNLETIMAGLSCGEPNPLAWEIIREFTDCYVSCGDFFAANGIRLLANPLAGDESVESGESGAVGIGLLDLLVNSSELELLRQELEIDHNARLLFFNTEGATDPENYRKILWHGKYSYPTV